MAVQGKYAEYPNSHPLFPPISPFLLQNFQPPRIGYGAAAALLSLGAHITLISSNQTNLTSALSRLNSSHAKGLVSDVRNETAYTATLLSLAPVDHIIFSAVDNIIRGPLVDASLDSAKHLFGVKFWGAVTTGKIVLKHDIIRPGGSLTLTSGTAALKPGRNAAIGGALNGGVCALTLGLAADLAEKRIRVNTVVPGLVKTPLWDKQGKSPQEQDELFKAAGEKLPVGFVATPEHIAEAYLYAVRADYTTGKLIEIGEFVALETGREGEGNVRYYTDEIFS